jgi:hypothetical protein
LTNDDSIVFCPADKGKAIVIEDRVNYISKEQDQIDQGDYKLAKASEKYLLNNLHTKLMRKLTDMGITEYNE